MVDESDRLSEEIESFVLSRNTEQELKKENDIIYDGVSFADVPVEIFIKICSFLDIEYVSTLGAVCKRFQNILSDGNLWRSWVNSRVCGKEYPPLRDLLDEIDWKKECIYIDKINSAWKTYDHWTFAFKEVHSAVIDALLLKNNGELCISGSRDRSIVLWDVKSIIQKNKTEKEQIEKTRPLIIFKDAHAGWVWGFSSPSVTSNLLYSCSWDYGVRIWDIDCALTRLHTFRCPTTVLCISCIDENVAAAGLFSPNVVLLDKRAGEQPVKIYRMHKRSILNITVSSPGSNRLFTSSEDCTIGYLDLRAESLVKTVKPLYKEEFKDRSQPYALKLAANNDIYANVLFAGDTTGALHVIDSNDLNVISSKEVNSSLTRHKITGLALDAGALVVSWSSGDIEVLNPSNPLNHVCMIEKQDSVTREITAVGFQNNILVAANDTPAVQFCMPRTDEFD